MGPQQPRTHQKRSQQPGPSWVVDTTVVVAIAPTPALRVESGLSGLTRHFTAGGTRQHGRPIASSRAQPLLSTVAKPGYRPEGGARRTGKHAALRTGVRAVPALRCAPQNAILSPDVS